MMAPTYTTTYIHRWHREWSERTVPVDVRGCIERSRAWCDQAARPSSTARRASGAATSISSAAASGVGHPVLLAEAMAPGAGRWTGSPASPHRSAMTVRRGGEPG
jgi:hypothetical protein